MNAQGWFDEHGLITPGAEALVQNVALKRGPGFAERLVHDGIRDGSMGVLQAYQVLEPAYLTTLAPGHPDPEPVAERMADIFLDAILAPAVVA